MTRRLIVFVALAVSVALPACGGDDDPSAELPPELTEEDNSGFAFSSTIKITESGFDPPFAVAAMGEPVTFVNETGRPQTITFTNGTLDANGEIGSIGPIAPGASEQRDVSIVISLIYESDGLPGYQGQLQTQEAAETL